MYFSYFISSFVLLGQQQDEPGGNVKSKWLVRVECLLTDFCPADLGLVHGSVPSESQRLTEKLRSSSKGNMLRGIKDHLLHDVINVLLSLCICRNNEAIGGPSAFHFRIRKLSEISRNVETQNASDLALKSSSFYLLPFR